VLGAAINIGLRPSFGYLQDFGEVDFAIQQRSKPDQSFCASMQNDTLRALLNNSKLRSILTSVANYTIDCLSADNSVTVHLLYADGKTQILVWNLNDPVYDQTPFSPPVKPNIAILPTDHGSPIPVPKEDTLTAIQAAFTPNLLPPSAPAMPNIAVLPTDRTPPPVTPKEDTLTAIQAAFTPNLLPPSVAQLANVFTPTPGGTYTAPTPTVPQDYILAILGTSSFLSQLPKATWHVSGVQDGQATVKLDSGATFTVPLS